MASQKPHKVQIAAFKSVGQLPGAAYFMEQGLGKTRTLLMDFADKLAAGTAQRLVVICPNSFKGGWKDEIYKWDYNFDVHIWESGQEYAAEAWLRREHYLPPVLIINYEAIRFRGTQNNPIQSAGQDFIADFIRDKLCMICADESIQISTYDSMQTKGALNIAPWFNWRRILSGKPMKAGPHDLWSQMRFIGHLNGQKYFPFRHAFCILGGYMAKQVIGVQNEDILAERIDPVVFRATKADWTDLPPKVYSIREYRLTPEMKNHYNVMEEEFVTWLADGDVVTVEAAISKYIKLAQIQAGFIYDNDSETQWLVDDAHNPRLAALRDFYDDELVGKAIVVYNHKPVGDQLMRNFADANPTFLHGGMTTAEIEANKRKFNEDRTCRIIFITKSAKYGHTLLGNQDKAEDACAIEIFYENTYSLDDRSQLEDRPHRHGQLQDAMSYIDFAGTPLDKSCVRSLQRKEGIFQSVFSRLKDRK